jgi:hypothetical protein
MTDKQISPAAQAVVDAAITGRGYLQPAIAAALRAAADQVVPKRDTPLLGDDASYANWNARDDVRDELLTIAAELDNS